MSAQICWLTSALCFIALAGCTRTHYQTRADRDAFSILHEKADCSPWTPPSDYSLYPSPASRLYDPTPIVDPRLPIPSPSLYTYDLPDLPTRDPQRFRPEVGEGEKPGSELMRLPPPPDDELGKERSNSPFAVASYRRQRESAGNQRQSPDFDSPLASESEGNEALSPSAEESRVEATALGVQQVAIDKSYWEDIPASCLRRMIEFESVRNEYGQTYGSGPAEELFDDAPKFALEDIIDLTLLNSREYQTEKEILYSNALSLSLERFDYQLKPSVTGNGTAADYTHDRFGGETVNALRVPTNAQVDKMLVTGGDLLARFANSVILTFNGPQGFAADVGSELLFDISQSVFQRDIRLESLTQAERDVVYAARDFARFRKTLFVSQAQQYYSLIRQYRQIEINSQNYFTLVRQFNQQAAEFRAGLTSRIELDQIEQQALNGRRGLITSCVNLEGLLDNLKIRIGLPTEQPINVDLTELNLLTLRDELAVNGELIERVRRRLITERRAEEPARATLLSASVVLLDRMLESIRLRERLGYQPPDPDQLRDFRGILRTDIGRLGVEEALEELNIELRSESPDQLTVFQRRIDVIRESRRLLQFQIELAEELERPAEQIADLRRQLEQQAQRLGSVVDRVQQLITEEQLDRLPQVVDEAARLQQAVAILVRAATNLAGLPDSQLPPEQEFQETIKQVDALLRESEEFLSVAEGGLVPVEISMDDATLTALVLRFDLINQRGAVADQRRQIKLAADDLKSILNLRATQSLRTRADVNRPFDFTFDESTTRLSLNFDAPFNRRAQRNGFRQSIINYQRTLRQLTLLEDTVKLSVRDDLRALTLDQEQYVIDVASAALAFERVVSTELELRLGIGSVIARDFLESQFAFINAVSSVASRHIDYIVDRTQLFLDLELLTVGDDGFWQQLYDEEYQPPRQYQLPAYARPAYGRLHPALKYSHRLRRTLNVPTGTSAIHAPADDAQKEESSAEQIATPPTETNQGAIED